MDKSKKNSPQVFVLTDIVKHVQGNCKYRLIGQKFMKLEDAFEEPFKSSEFQIYIASQISSTTFECDENMISAKMYPFPLNLNCPSDVNSRTQKWFVSKLHHTMQN